MSKDKKHKDKRKEKHKDKKKHRSGIKKSKKHKSPKEKHARKDSDSDSSSSSSSGGARRSVVTGEKIKMNRHADEASRREEARREAIREQMNDGEVFGSVAPAVPMSSFERAVNEKLKDKEGLHQMMLAKVEHAKFQASTISRHSTPPYSTHSNYSISIPSPLTLNPTSPSWRPAPVSETGSPKKVGSSRSVAKWAIAEQNHKQRS